MNDIVYVGRHALMHTVQRHAHESWEFIYCTYGTGSFAFDHCTLPYREGHVVVIPPMIPHANSSEHGFRNIHVNMVAPTLHIKEPLSIQDDSNRFLLNAFNAAYYHYHSDRPERTALLASYGDLISCYLTAYQTVSRKSSIVEEIEHDIIRNYSDSAYQLDAYLRSLPFSYDYLRKLFQKEIGVTPHQYLSDKRLQSAAELLVNLEIGGGSITDVAALCGFREPLYFSRIFKKKYGVAPSYYARIDRSAQREEMTADNIKVLLEDV